MTLAALGPADRRREVDQFIAMARVLCRGRYATQAGADDIEGQLRVAVGSGQIDFRELEREHESMAKAIFAHFAVLALENELSRLSAIEEGVADQIYELLYFALKASEFCMSGERRLSDVLLAATSHEIIRRRQVEAGHYSPSERRRVEAKPVFLQLWSDGIRCRGLARWADRITQEAEKRDPGVRERWSMSQLERDVSAWLAEVGHPVRSKKKVSPTGTC